MLFRSQRLLKASLDQLRIHSQGDENTEIEQKEKEDAVNKAGK